jgi:hypothetical protein
MLRPVLFLHRWLGIVIGAIMTLWCLSGFVMMYVDYPRLLPADQLRGLAPLQLPAPDALGRVDLPASAPIASAKLEMMAGRPVLRVVPAIDPGRPIAQMRKSPGGYALSTGKPIATLAPGDIRAIGVTFGQRSGIAGAPGPVAVTGIDQWTVQTFRRNQPLYRIDYRDPAATTAYVAGNSGEVVQRTTRFQRFWGWLGAVPHWLYPTILRQNGEAWSQVVIWTSLIGCFLTVTGLWVGISRLRRRRDGSIGSPCKGLWWWHHMFGLFFGLLTLTWVASGLFSMNPWGFLDSMAGLAEGQRLAGPMTWGDLRGAAARLPAMPAGTVRVQSAPLGGKVFLVAVGRDGRMTRFDASGKAAPLGETELKAALRQGPAVASLEKLEREDAYYYTHRYPMKLPVWRAILSDPEATRLYIDPDSGALVQTIDSNGRAYRWLESGLHSLDFPVLRTRPLWDIVVLPLLMAVTLVCGTGTWMGIRKLGRDLRKLRRHLGYGAGLRIPTGWMGRLPALNRSGSPQPAARGRASRSPTEDRPSRAGARNRPAGP